MKKGRINLLIQDPNMTKAVLSCTLILFLQACSSQLVSTEEGKQLLSPPAEPADTAYFINQFEIAEIIPIQTNEKTLVSDIKRVIRYLDRIILLSGENNTVFVINADDGVIETSINNIGKGPGEWKTILDIAFDRESKELLIYNDYSKLLSFDIRGRFLAEYEVNDLYENIQERLNLQCQLNQRNKRLYYLSNQSEWSFYNQQSRKHRSLG